MASIYKEGQGKINKRVLEELREFCVADKIVDCVELDLEKILSPELVEVAESFIKSFS